VSLLSDDRIDLVIRAFELSLDAERVIRQENPGVQRPRGISTCRRAFGEIVYGVITDALLESKYDPSLPWSDAARTAPRKELRFEHVISKDALRRRMLEDWRNREHVRRVLIEASVFAIIAKDEHGPITAARRRFLKDGGDLWADPWAPYRLAGINVSPLKDEARATHLPR
jgi:hypothetical protein